MKSYLFGFIVTGISIIALFTVVFFVKNKEYKVEEHPTYNVEVTSETPSEILEEYYVYEIHTVGGVHDTLKLRNQIKPIQCRLSVKELGIDYSYVDKFRMLYHVKRYQDREIVYYKAN